MCMTVVSVWWPGVGDSSPKTMSLGLDGGVSSTDRSEESLLLLLLLDFLSSLSSSFSKKLLLLSELFFCTDFVLFRRLLLSLMQVSGLASMNPGAKVQ